MSKKVHIALASNDIAKAVEDYTQRLGCKPEVVVPGVYALWRTDVLNLSVRQDSTCKPGELRHLGFEDDAAEKFSEERDCHGIVWERFTAEQQQDEIRAAWPIEAEAIGNTPSVGRGKKDIEATHREQFEQLRKEVTALSEDVQTSSIAGVRRRGFFGDVREPSDAGAIGRSQMILMARYVHARRVREAICLLEQASLSEQAFANMRTLLDILIHLNAIERDPKNALRQYYHGANLSFGKFGKVPWLAEEVNKVREGGFEEQAIADLGKPEWTWLQHAKGHFRDPNNSKKTLSAEALLAAFGLRDAYGTIFNASSSSLHAGDPSRYVNAGKDGEMVTVPRRRDLRVVHLAELLFLQVLKIIDEIGGGSNSKALADLESKLRFILPDRTLL